MNRRQRLRAQGLAVALGCCLSLACGDPALERAVESYRERRDYPSLTFIQRHLAHGMPRERVLELLGPPMFSTADGLAYYPSSTRDDEERSLGLMIDYRDGSGRDTGRLQRNLLRPLPPASGSGGRNPQDPSRDTKVGSEG